MANKVLRRSPNKQLAGVCAGIAEYLEVSPQNVRIATFLLAFFTSAPVVVLYILLAFILPMRPAHPGEGLLEATWQQDGLRVSWQAPVAASVGWPRWLIGVAVVAVVVAIVGMLGLGALDGGWRSVPLLGAMLASLPMAGPLALVGAMVGLSPRTFTLTVTHAALWVEVPLRKARRIELEEVEDLHIGDDGLVLHLRDGELIRLPGLPADDDGVLEVLRDQVLRSHQRALEHQEDLEAADDRRRELERVLREGSREG